MSAPQARMLDVTRLVSRSGRHLTGVDRVERAYLRALLAGQDDIYLLARIRGGYVLLDRGGGNAVLARLSGDYIAQGDPAAEKKITEALLRRAALARCLPFRLRPMLASRLPAGTIYLNTGHSNLSHRVLNVICNLPEARISVLLHDMIPLDYPQFQRPGTVKKFEEKMLRVSQVADLVICNSTVTQSDITRHFGSWGRVPEILVSHLGLDPVTPDPDFEVPEKPYFVALGTIEPRKNHNFLLDIWEEFSRNMDPGQIPRLYIVGRRGWNNESVFARLDQLPPNGPVTEVSDMDDAPLRALLSGAAGLLSPSFAEGYGLPLLEAASLGTPILANDLAVYREFLSDIPVYASVSDGYLWARTIIKMAGAQQSAVPDRAQAKLPVWEDHFNRVLRVT